MFYYNLSIVGPRLAPRYNYPMNLTTIVYALLAGVLPSLLWLWFWLKEDSLHPEPKKILALSFIGGAISVVIAIVLERYVQGFVLYTTHKYITWAAIEEIVKFLVVLAIAFRSKYIDEPIDIMIYCITVALGFSAAENTLFILTPLSEGNLTTTLLTSNLRFIGATLVHVVSSASIGFMVGLVFYHKKITKFIFALLGIILSVVLHAGFNLAIINGTATSTLKIFGWVWCAVVILIILFEEIKAVHHRPGDKTV
jgi:RsiW-degrading membrane proteinase PrsW (M82 family)